MAPGFGLAPQPKGIGDASRRLACFRSNEEFGLAPQPKGIGDLTRFPRVLLRTALRLD